MNSSYLTNSDCVNVQCTINNSGGLQREGIGMFQNNHDCKLYHLIPSTLSSLSYFPSKLQGTIILLKLDNAVFRKFKDDYKRNYLTCNSGSCQFMGNSAYDTSVGEKNVRNYNSQYDISFNSHDLQLSIDHVILGYINKLVKNMFCEKKIFCSFERIHLNIAYSISF